MIKSYLLPLAVIVGLLLAFAYVFRDKANPLSRWVSGGRATGTLIAPLPDSGNPQS